MCRDPPTGVLLRSLSQAQGVPGRAPSGGRTGPAGKLHPEAVVVPGCGSGLCGSPREGAPAWPSLWRIVLLRIRAAFASWEHEHLWEFHCAWLSGVPMTVTIWLLPLGVGTGPGLLSLHPGHGPLDPRGDPVTWLEL